MSDSLLSGANTGLPGPTAGQAMDLPDGPDGSDDQLRRARDLYRDFRGTGVTLRQLFTDTPTSLFVTLLELGYRVALEPRPDGVGLRFEPDGSTPRDPVLTWRGGSSAHSVATSSAGVVYSTTTEDRIAMVDASTRRLIGHVAVGHHPEHLALSPDESRVYTANVGSDDVTIVDARGVVVATTPTGSGPVLPCPAGGIQSVWVPSRADGSITVVRADGETMGTVGVGVAPHDLALSPDGRLGYQPNQVSGTVTVIDVAGLRAIAEVPVGIGPCHAAFTPDSEFAYVTNTVSNEISVIRTRDHEVVATMRGGIAPHLPVVSDDGRRGYVANFVSDDITIFDVRTSKVLAVVPVGVYPHAIALSPNDRHLVVSNTGASSVCLLDTTALRVRTTIDVGGAPGHISFDPAGRVAFVACERDNHIAVIDLAADCLIDTVPLDEAA